MKNKELKNKNINKRINCLNPINKCINCANPINRTPTFKKRENIFINIYNELGNLHFCCLNCKIQWIYKIQKVKENNWKIGKEMWK